MKVSKSIIVGVFLIGGLVLFGVGLFMIGSENNLFSHEFDVYAYFSNVNGLASGAKVHVSGLDAGSVSDIRIPSTSGARFRVTLSVKQKFRPLVRQNSVASISSQWMVGTSLWRSIRAPGKHRSVRTIAPSKAANRLRFRIC